MAYPFTPAQLAIFKAALANLSGSIAQGDKALADEAYIRQCEAAITKPEVIPAAVVATAQTVNQAVDLPSPSLQERTPVTEIPVVAPTVPATPIVAETPKPIVNEVQASPPPVMPSVASEASKAKKGIFGFNWFGKKTSAEDAPVITTRVEHQAPVQAETIEPKKLVQAKVIAPEQAKAVVKPDSEIEKAVRVRIAEGWVVNHFFAELPWDKPSAKAATIAVAAAPVRVSADVANWTVSGFFTNLPWAFRPLGSLTPILQPGIKVRATLATQTVQAYFSEIPWTAKKITSASAATVTASLPGNLGSHSASSFFASAPWQFVPATPAIPSITNSAKVVRINSQDDKEAGILLASATHSVPAATAKNDLPKNFGSQRVGIFFADAPWQAAPADKLSIAARPGGVIRINAQEDKEASNMFAAATHSALAAAGKAAAKHSSAITSATRVDRYFNALPWANRG